MKGNIFRSYNKVKYLLRVKHWRGRSVHSPFLYDVVRSAFMKNETIDINSELCQKLETQGVRHGDAQRICRLYSHLNYNSYTLDVEKYNGEDLVVICDNDIDIEALLKVSEMASAHKQTVCVVINQLYKNRKRYKTWQLISTISGGVAVDLYHNGFLFFDYYLNKQKFKMRL